MSSARGNAASWSPQCGDVIGVIYTTPLSGTNQFIVLEVPYPCIPCVSVSKVVACLDANGACGSFSHQAGGYVSAGASPSAYPAFCYDITVTNCGGFTLTNLTVLDNLLGDLTPYFFGPGSNTLAPSQALTQKFNMAFATNAVNTVLVQGRAVLAHSVTNAGGSVITNGTYVAATDKATALVDTVGVYCDVSMSATNDLDGNLTDNHVLLPSTTDSNTVVFNVTVFNTNNCDLLNVTVSGLSCGPSAPFTLPADNTPMFNFVCNPLIAATRHSPLLSPVRSLLIPATALS